MSKLFQAEPAGIQKILAPFCALFTKTTEAISQYSGMFYIYDVPNWHGLVSSESNVKVTFSTLTYTPLSIAQLQIQNFVLTIYFDRKWTEIANYHSFPSTDILSLHAKTQIHRQKDEATVFSAKSQVTWVLVGKICRAFKAAGTFHRLIASYRLCFALLLCCHESLRSGAEKTEDKESVHMLSARNLIKGLGQLYPLNFYLTNAF